MTDKIVRDELLRSHRYQTLPTDTVKLFFFHLMLSSDGHSNAETTTTALSIIMGRHVSEETAASLLAELADRDLVRLYECDGKRYAHIPRSRQRIRYPTAKHPRPPASIEDKQINDVLKKVGPKSDISPTQVRRSEVKRSEVIQKQLPSHPVHNSNVVTVSKPQTFMEVWTAKGKALSINPNPGESARDYCIRVAKHVKGE